MNPTPANPEPGSYRRDGLTTPGPCPSNGVTNRHKAHIQEKLLDAIPDNPVGLRDRAIILTLTLTGRRRAEVLSLKAITSQWS